MDKESKNKENSTVEGVDKKESVEEIQTISLKSNQSISESNLMTIPFISMQRTKVQKLERFWESNGIKRGITVAGGSNGCPTILELDVLLALFRILLKNIDFKYELNKTTGQVTLPQKINFTYMELSRELNFSEYGGNVKKRLEKSIKTLLETTIYSNFALRDASLKEYVVDFQGEESFRILKNYKSYSYNIKRKKGEKIDNPKTIKELQSVEIDDFFFNNIFNNYFKIYDYKKYIILSKGISKKLYLLLNQWSFGYEKFLRYETLFDYLSLQVDTDQKKYYYAKQIKEALDELKKVKFIDDYDIRISEGVNIIFNLNKKKQVRQLYKYREDQEVIDKLDELGFTGDEALKYFRLDNEQYVKALLRYVDDKASKGEVTHIKEYVEKGLITERYNVDNYMV